MDSSLRELFNQTLNLSPREKVDIARRALQEINQYLKKLKLSDEQVTLFVVNITKLFVSADNRKEDDEYYFFSAVIEADISQEYFDKMVEGGDDPKFINDTIAAVKTFDPDARLAVLTYGMMIMACDDYIHFKETDIVKRLMRIL